jgi:hypothetical protein
MSRQSLTVNKIPHILWSLKIHSCVHNSLPPVPVLGEIKQTITQMKTKKHFIIKQRYIYTYNKTLQITTEKNPVADGRIILKWTSKKNDMMMWTDSVSLGCSQVAESHETSASIKGRETLWDVSYYQLIKELLHLVYKLLAAQPNH